MRWIIEVPDIHVTACTGVMKPLLGSQKNYASEIYVQTLFSAAAFIIEHPDKASDQVAVYQAAVEGALHTYKAILKTKPKAKWPALDDLIVKRDSGTLAESIREAASDCK